MADFVDGANWAILYDSLITAQGVAGSPLTYVPIAPVTLSEAANYSFLRVTANYEAAKMWWRLGAWIDFLVNENNPEVEAARVLAPVNTPIIIPKPAFLDSYRIRATIPYYFEEIDLRIEGYTGIT